MIYSSSDLEETGSERASCNISFTQKSLVKMPKSKKKLKLKKVKKTKNEKTPKVIKRFTLKNIKTTSMKKEENAEKLVKQQLSDVIHNEKSDEIAKVAEELESKEAHILAIVGQVITCEEKIKCANNATKYLKSRKQNLIKSVMGRRAELKKQLQLFIKNWDNVGKDMDRIAPLMDCAKYNTDIVRNAIELGKTEESLKRQNEILEEKNKEIKSWTYRRSPIDKEISVLKAKLKKLGKIKKVEKVDF
jgi:hypothetical protein